MRARDAGKEARAVHPARKTFGERRQISGVPLIGLQARSMGRERQKELA